MNTGNRNRQALPRTDGPRAPIHTRSLSVLGERAKQRRNRVSGSVADRFQRTIDTGPVPMMIVRVADAIVLWVNVAALDLLTAPESDLVGRPASACFGITPDQWAGYIERGRQGPYIRDVQLEITRSDGTQVWVDLIAQPLRFGLSDGLLLNFQDITRLKHTEESLRSSESLHRSVVDTASDAIVTMTAEGRIRSFNKGAERIFGYRRSEAIGQTLTILMPERFRELHTRGMERYLATNVPRVIGTAVELVGLRKGGEEFPVELNIGEVRNEDERLFTGIMRDISHRKQVEEELRQARIAAESANAAKSAFLATMSHEIRTPMNGVIGMTSLLLETELTPDQQEFAETIRDSGEALLTLINDILDYSKIEAGKLELECEPFDIRASVEGALDLVAPRAAEKDLDLACLIADDVPLGMVGDSVRLRQVLLNLLSNAVKFTERGEVELLLSARVADEQHSVPPLAGSGDVSEPLYELHVTVRDTGIGIPPERLDRLFQSFSQLDASTTRQYGGTGLGLAISKRLTELMGGSIWCESAGAGTGATFHVVLRLRSASSFRSGAHLLREQPHLKGKRVLIVDDNDTNRRILSLQLQKWGVITHATASPYEALDWIRAADAFSLVILDQHMPEMDGITLAETIHEVCNGNTPPLILFSSLGQRHRAMLDVEFAASLSKPLKPSQLHDALVGVFADDAPARVPDQAPARVTGSRDVRPLRILLAEDNVVNQKLAVRMLERLGLGADIAQNGKEVLLALEAGQYDVVLMDVQMPEMDGLEATRQIHVRWPGPDRPWIIAMTANAMQGDREEYLAIGMDDYVSKPVHLEDLEHALARVPSGNAATRSVSP